MVKLVKEEKDIPCAVGFGISTPEQAAHELQRAGYATDPQYASKLVSVIQQMKHAGAQAVKAYAADINDLF